jgi:hypothetical protein
VDECKPLVGGVGEVFEPCCGDVCEGMGEVVGSIYGVAQGICSCIGDQI